MHSPRCESYIQIHDMLVQLLECPVVSGSHCLFHQIITSSSVKILLQIFTYFTTPEQRLNSLVSISLASMYCCIIYNICKENSSSPCVFFYFIIPLSNVSLLSSISCNVMQKKLMYLPRALEEHNCRKPRTAVCLQQARKDKPA